MKKLNIIFSILILSLVFVACDSKKETNDETNKETNIESTEESKGESAEETTKETTVESKEETKERTVEKTNSETTTEEESKNESTKETESEKIVEVVDDEKDDNKTVVETINTEKSDQDQFNNDMTEEMKNTINKYGLTLLSNGQPVDQFPTEDLQAIASYKDSQSYGWVVRYGKNKIALARKYNEAQNGVPFTMFDGRGILKEKEEIIKNDSPEEFKQRAQEIIKVEIPGDAKIEYAY